jgi:hypothetical protein
MHIRFWWGNPEGNRTLERPRRRLDLSGRGWIGMAWVTLTQGRDG